jgi:hypothetical protein
MNTDALSRALRQAVAVQPFMPDPTLALDRARRLRRRRRAGLTGLAVVLLAVVVSSLLIPLGTASSSRPATVVPSPVVAPRPARPPRPPSTPPGLHVTGRAALRASHLPTGAEPEELGTTTTDGWTRDVYSLPGLLNAQSPTPNSPSQQLNSHPATYLSLGLRRGTLGAPPALGPGWNVTPTRVQGVTAYLVRFTTGFGDRWLTWSDGKWTYEVVSPRWKTTGGPSGISDVELLRVANGLRPNT